MERNKQTPEVSPRRKLIIHMKKYDSPQVETKENIEKEEEKSQEKTPSHTSSDSISEVLPPTPLVSNINRTTTKPSSPTHSPPLPPTTPSPCFPLPPSVHPPSSPSFDNNNNNNIDNDEIYDREKFVNVIKNKESSIKEKAHYIRLLTDNITEDMSGIFLSGVQGVLFKQEQILNMGKDILNKNESKDCEEFYREIGRLKVATNYHWGVFIDRLEKKNELYMYGLSNEGKRRKVTGVTIKESKKKRTKKTPKKKEIIEIDSDESDDDEIMDFEDEDGLDDFAIKEESDDDSSYNPRRIRKKKKKVDVKFIKKVTTNPK